MKENVFNKEAFIEDVKENVKNLYRKTLDEASQQEIFQAVSYTVKDVIIDDWLATQKAFDKQDPKMVYYMSMEFLMGRHLETVDLAVLQPALWNHWQHLDTQLTAAVSVTVTECSNRRSKTVFRWKCRITC